MGEPNTIETASGTHGGQKYRAADMYTGKQITQRKGRAGSLQRSGSPESVTNQNVINVDASMIIIVGV
jgi:hypothetical protein